MAAKSFKIPASGGGDGKPRLPPGSYAAYCISVIDLGLQQKRGKFPGVAHQVQLTFEVPEVIVEFEDNGQKHSAPAVIGQRFTYSMHKKAGLRKFVESLAGKSFPSDEAASSFDVAGLLGRQFLLNIEHVERAEKTYANIKSAGPCPKQMKTEKPQYHKSWLYVLADPDPELFAQFPEWLQKVINDRVKVNDTNKPSSVAQNAGDLDDDIPF